MRIIAFITVYKRLDLLKLSLRSLNEAIKAVPTIAGKYIQLKVFLVYSDIPDYEEIYSFLKKLNPIYDYWFSFAPNRPLGLKHNTGLSNLRFSHDFDYLFQLGSDDLLHKDFFAHVEKYIENKVKLFGFTNLVFFDKSTHRAKIYFSNEVFGAGRFIHVSVVNKMIDPNGNSMMWNDTIDYGLDGNSEQNIYTICGFKNVRSMPVVCNKPLIVDIKSELNIHKYNDVPGMGLNKHNIELLIKEFPELAEI